MKPGPEVQRHLASQLLRPGIAVLFDRAVEEWVAAIPELPPMFPVVLVEGIDWH